MFSAKPFALAFCLALTGCAHSDENAKADASHGWWPFGAEQTEAKIVAEPKPKPQSAQAWLEQYEPRLREALKDSRFELERRDNLLVVIAPVDSSFNPDRPGMLLPVTLGPFSRIAKLVEGDTKTGVLVLGHADSSGNASRNHELSRERAGAVAAIFRLSGLKRDRLLIKGLGSERPRATNDSTEGRARNRRVEILLTPQDSLLALLGQYNQPAKVASVPVPALAAEQAK